MKLQIGNFYKILIIINGVTLTYNCKITFIDEHFISFLDKFNKEYTYNKNLILSIEKVQKKEEIE